MAKTKPHAAAARRRRAPQLCLLGLLLLGWLTPGVAATERGLLWRVTAPSGETVAYLLGAIHLGRAALYPLPKTVEHAIAATETLVLELDPTGPGMAGATAVLLQRGMWPSGRTLADAVPRRLWREVEEAAAKAGILGGVIARQKPWLAANSLLAGLLKQAGWSAAEGIELHLIDRLKPQRPVIELETATFQAELLSSLPKREQIAMLRDVASAPDALIGEMDALVAAWQAGAAARFNRLVQAGFGADLTVSRERLLAQRNASMSERLGRLLLDGRRHLVAVGAAHFPGRDGIVAALRSRGFRVEQQ